VLNGIQAGFAQILQSNSNVASINCGSAILRPWWRPVSPLPVAWSPARWRAAARPQLLPGAGTCTGINPSAGNTVQVGLRPGATFSWWAPALL